QGRAGKRVADAPGRGPPCEPGFPPVAGGRDEIAVAWQGDAATAQGAIAGSGVLVGAHGGLMTCGRAPGCRCNAEFRSRLPPLPQVGKQWTRPFAASAAPTGKGMG